MVGLGPRDTPRLFSSNTKHSPDPGVSNSRKIIKGRKISLTLDILKGLSINVWEGFVLQKEKKRKFVKSDDANLKENQGWATGSNGDDEPDDTSQPKPSYPVSGD